jgi:proteasome accessory factor C
LHQILKVSHYPVSISQLCEQLETSDKTLYRDIREFRDLYSAPIELHDGLVSYDKTSKQNFELPGIWFSDDELQAMLAAQQLLSEIQPGILDVHISPLKKFIVNMLSQHGHVTEQSLNRIRILGIGQRCVQTRYFDKVAAAVLGRMQLKINYMNRQTAQSSQRLLSPQRLIFYRNNWYVDAWCHLRKGLRTFSLDNIEKAELQNTTAEDVNEDILAEHFESAFGIFSGEADKTAILKFNKPSATYIPKPP